MPPDILESSKPLLSSTSDMPATPPTPAPESTPAPGSTPEPAPTPTPTPEPTPAPSTETPAAATPAPAKEPIGARISELVRQRREADERVARYELLVQQLLENKAQTAASPPTTESPAVSVPTEARPVREAFPDVDAYETALVEWGGKQAAAKAVEELRRARETDEQEARAKREREAEEQRTREAQEQARTESATVWSKFTAAEEVARAKYEDFDAVAHDDSVPVSNSMANIIVRSSAGPDIAYYLGKNKDEAARIASMVIPGQVYPLGHPEAGRPVPNIAEQAYALGLIAAKVAAAATPPVTPTPEPNANNLNGNGPPAPAAPAAPATPAPTEAARVVIPVPVLPAPPNLISGTGPGGNKDIAEMSMEEYAAMRNPQLQAERRPGRRLN